MDRVLMDDSIVQKPDESVILQVLFNTNTTFLLTNL